MEGENSRPGRDAGFVGAGNLLGNLLCAVVHLLDGPGALAGILNILDQINSILG